MEFFEKHFTKARFRKHPLKWLLALLLSPIHAAEVHYKRKYHLQFRHARKLFLFDMSLLAGTLTLAVATVFWFTYDPTISSLVYLDISSTSHDGESGMQRIESGNFVSYTISYENGSDLPLKHPNLSLKLPPGFELESAEPKDMYHPEQRSFSLSEIPSGESGAVRISGRLFAEPEQETVLSGRLSYQQPEREKVESAHTHLLIIPRGSIFETNLEAQEYILEQGTGPIVYTITNTSEVVVQNVHVSLAQSAGIELAGSTSTIGTIHEKTWSIPLLGPQETAELRAVVRTNVSAQTQKAPLTLSSFITIDETTIMQTEKEHVYTVVHPKAVLESSWEDTSVSPYAVATMNVAVANTGDIDFEQAKLHVSLPAGIVDTKRFQTLNKGVYRNGKFVVDLSNIPRSDTKQVSFQVPIRSLPQGGTDITLSIPVELSTGLSASDGTYTTHTQTPNVQVGTELSLFAESRYFTVDGDQLGRGPLPPRVGKETKYWAFVTLKNNSSRVDNVSFSAKLPPHIYWTGRTSVSRGNNVAYNKSTHSVHWSANSLAPYDTAGIYMELGFVPSTAQVGSAPLLLQNISASGSDSFIQKTLNRTAENIDIGVKNDEIAKKKGTTVR